MCDKAKKSFDPQRIGTLWILLLCIDEGGVVADRPFVSLYSEVKSAYVSLFSFHRLIRPRRRVCYCSRAPHDDDMIDDRDTSALFTARHVYGVFRCNRIRAH